MTQDKDVPNPFDEGVVEKAAVDSGFEAIKKIHAIERQMLNRAIHALSDITGKTVEEVLSILAEGINSDYDQAIQQVEAAAEVAKLYVPTKKPTWEK